MAVLCARCPVATFRADVRIDRAIQPGVAIAMQNTGCAFVAGPAGVRPGGAPGLQVAVRVRQTWRAQLAVSTDSSASDAEDAAPPLAACRVLQAGSTVVAQRHTLWRNVRLIAGKAIGAGCHMAQVVRAFLSFFQGGTALPALNAVNALLANIAICVAVTICSGAAVLADRPFDFRGTGHTVERRTATVQTRSAVSKTAADTQLFNTVIGHAVIHGAVKVLRTRRVVLSRQAHLEAERAKESLVAVSVLKAECAGASRLFAGARDCQRVAAQASITHLELLRITWIAHFATARASFLPVMKQFSTFKTRGTE